MRKLALVLAGVLAAAVLLGIGIAIGSAGKTTVHEAGKTVVKTVPGPVVTKTVAPAPPAAGTTLLDFSGKGSEVTPAFSVSGDGDYILSWTFSGNDSSGTPDGDNFIVNENDPNSDGFAANLPNLIQSSGSGSTGVNGDTGTHSFSVQADAGCTWTLKVVTAP